MILTVGLLYGNGGGLLYWGRRSKIFRSRPAEEIAVCTFGAYARACPSIQEPKIKASATLFQ